MRYVVTCFLVLYILPLTIQGQDISTIKNATPFKINGSIYTGLNYLNDERGLYEDNFGYYVGGDINFKFYENFNIPISFRYSDTQTTFNKPVFKNYGLSPSYKWVKLHGGYRNYKLSPYLYNGRTILGGGIELTPGIFRFLAFYGNLTHEYNYGYNIESLSSSGIDYYKRKCYGGKIGLAKGKKFISLLVFKAKDSDSKDVMFLRDSLSILPEESFGLGLDLGLPIFKIGSFKAKIAANSYNEDLNATESTDINNYELISKFQTVNESSRYGLAYDMEFDFNIKRLQIGLVYSHIDLGFRSLGLVHLIPDVDNYTIRLNTSLFNSSLNLFGNIGIQYQGTEGYSPSKESRLIINGGASIRPSENLNLTLNYNNFSTESAPQILEFNDSLKLVANNTGFSANASYNFGAKEVKNTITFSASHNTFSIIQLDSEISDNTSRNASLGYRWNQKKSGWSYGLNMNYLTTSSSYGLPIKRLGSKLNIRKTLNKNFNLSFSPSYNINYSDNIRDGYYTSISSKLNYKLPTKTRFSLSFTYKNRATQRIEAFNQFRTSLSINQSF